MDAPFLEGTAFVVPFFEVKMCITEKNRLI